MKQRYTPTMKLLDKLYRLQKELCLTQSQLVKKIGISLVTLHLLKTGRTANPNSITMKKIMSFMKMHESQAGSFKLATGPGIVKQAKKVCHLCDKYPQVREELLEDMNCIIRETLQEYGERK